MTEKKELTDAWDKLGVSPTSIGQVPKLLDIAWHMPRKMTICLVGETGIGKTPIVHQWAKKQNGYMKVLNFGHMTQEEISMVMFSEQGDRFGFVPPEWMLELNKKAAEQGCAVLFLDEWNRGDKALVNALFTLTDDRRVHDFHLNENVLVVAAMNPSDGSYLVNEAEKDHAIRKRLNFVFCTHDLQAWLEHTQKEKWFPLVPAFIKAASPYLYDVVARDSGRAFPCPSNWEKVSNIMFGANKCDIAFDHPTVRTLVEGQIGSAAAKKFLDFVINESTLIQPKEVLHEYTLTSPVRKKVAEMLNCTIDRKTKKFVENASKSNRAGVISELNQSIAIELFSDMPKVEKIAPQLSLYIGDLPEELLGTFAAQHLTEQKTLKGSTGETYLHNLSTELQKHPEYRARLKAIIMMKRDYKAKAEGSNVRDPMA